MMSEMREAVVAGGPISYGPYLPGIFCQVGVYVGKISTVPSRPTCRSTKPTRFELVINLKTANALGLTLPRTILARADEVLE
jgi:putative ABC transport system substrate-binding protein